MFFLDRCYFYFSFYKKLQQSLSLSIVNTEAVHGHFNLNMTRITQLKRNLTVTHMAKNGSVGNPYAITTKATWLKSNSTVKEQQLIPKNSRPLNLLMVLHCYGDGPQTCLRKCGLQGTGYHRLGCLHKKFLTTIRQQQPVSDAIVLLLQFLSLFCFIFQEKGIGFCCCID